VFKWFRHLPGYKITGSSPQYEQDLAASRFCLAPAGAGWGKRNVLAAISGCVPVVVSDGIYQPFEPQLDWTSFGLRVREGDVERLPQILEAVSEEELRRKQVRRGGGGLWAADRAPWERGAVARWPGGPAARWRCTWLLRLPQPSTRALPPPPC
jgi:hypothetical protein